MKNIFINNTHHPYEFSPGVLNDFKRLERHIERHFS